MSWSSRIFRFEFAIGAVASLDVRTVVYGPDAGRPDTSRDGGRRGRRNRQEFDPVSPVPRPQPSFGLFLLWRGWIGFNCGSIVVRLDHGPREYHSRQSCTLSFETCTSVPSSPVGIILIPMGWTMSDARGRQPSAIARTVRRATDAVTLPLTTRELVLMPAIIMALHQIPQSPTALPTPNARRRYGSPSAEVGRWSTKWWASSN